MPRFKTTRLGRRKGFGLFCWGRTFRHRGTSADRGVLKQIFRRRCYSLHRYKRGSEVRELYKTIIEAGKLPLIVDAGANIGASVVWFARQFPDAQIAAFEPDPNNFSLLEINTAGLNVELHHAAVSSRDGRVNLSDPGLGEWGYQTELSDAGAIRSVGLNDFILGKIQQGFRPLIVKIDIEGAEGELFTGKTDWLAECPLLIMELHDWLLPRAGTSQPFLRTIAAVDRDFVHAGENIFSFRN